ncbi:hypothetical protein BROUX41_004045 [Berkeleyomyces rouxiae]|uniref:uncharacterized protein n=1 Tax=Berkeleyomyces rouxiae TaxID=2035830 RepID=UPI003B7C59B4
MIQELANYEKEPNSVEATEQKLLSTIAFASPASTQSPDDLNAVEPTTPSRPARCLILLEGGKAAGMALYFYNYSTWRAKPGIYLEDLFVHSAYRKRGYGKRLLAELARAVLDIDGGRLEWVVLKWNEPSIRFYESIGAKRMDDWVGMRVDNEALVRLAGTLNME